MSHWVFPGSFDPITSAHVELALRAAKMCDTLTVAVLQNRDKPAPRSLDLRCELLRKAFAGCPNIRVDGYSGVLVDYVKLQGADAIVRGIRNTADMEYEFPWAKLHYASEGVETLFLAPTNRYPDLSSSMVRQWASLGKDISGMVPDAIRQDVERLYGTKL